VGWGGDGGASSLLFNGYHGVLSCGMCRDHSLTSSAEVKNEWSHTSAPPVCLRGEDRNIFTVSEKVNFV